MASSHSLNVVPSPPSNSSVLTRLREDLTGPRSQAVGKFVQTLRTSFTHYSWVGVYLVKGGNLALEAYAGDQATQHVTIPIGQGVCGAAAKKGETITVDDVSKDPRYLMCFPSTRSEIVVPMKTSRGVIGEIDIDSDRLAAFSAKDREFLENVAKLLGSFLDQK